MFTIIIKYNFIICVLYLYVIDPNQTLRYVKLHKEKGKSLEGKKEIIFL